MNKSESKYFNTTRLMDEALILLLEKKEIEYITIKEICQTAGVNRSTFYLHYENIYDLLNEALEMLSSEYASIFKAPDILSSIQNGSATDVMFIKPEFIVPYLEFVKKNARIFKAIRSKPKAFGADSAYQKMCNEVFYPILDKFNVEKERKPYILEFFTKGILGIVNKWIATDCKDEISLVTDIIMGCFSRVTGE